MKWSFSIAVAKLAEIGPELRTQLDKVIANIVETEKRELAVDDYIKNADAICNAAQAIASALPEQAGRLLSVNVVGQIVHRVDTGELGAAEIAVRVDSVPG